MKVIEDRKAPRWRGFPLAGLYVLFDVIVGLLDAERLGEPDARSAYNRLA